MEQSIEKYDHSGITIFTDNSLIEQVVDKEVKRRKTKTHPSKIKTRTGKAGQVFKYIGSLTPYQWLDKNFPLYSWEVLPNSINQLASWVSIAGTLTVIDPQTGIKRVITRYGSKEGITTKGGDTASIQYLKAAETDAIKRCCIVLGAFNDVYGEIEEEDEEKLDINRAWYATNILPKIMTNQMFINKPELIIKQILRFEAGLLTKEKLEQTYL